MLMGTNISSDQSHLDHPGEQEEKSFVSSTNRRQSKQQSRKTLFGKVLLLGSPRQGETPRKFLEKRFLLLKLGSGSIAST